MLRCGKISLRRSYDNFRINFLREVTYEFSTCLGFYARSDFLDLFLRFDSIRRYVTRQRSPLQ